MKLASKGTNQRTTKRSRDYSIAADFSHAFNDRMDRFYTLAFLLTTDHQTAEQVFLAALEDCLQGMPVFKEWVPSWSKRAVIKAAIRIVRTSQAKTAAPEKSGMGPHSSLGLTVAAALAGLQELERFAYVLTVLERYSDRECSVLLDSTVGEIVRARIQALHKVADILLSSSFFNVALIPRDQTDNLGRKVSTFPTSERHTYEIREPNIIGCRMK